MNGGWKVKPTAVIQRYAFKVICNSSSSMEVLSYFFFIQHLIKHVCRATNVGDFLIATYLLLTYLPFRRIIFDRILYFVILWNINFFKFKSISIRNNITCYYYYYYEYCFIWRQWHVFEYNKLISTNKHGM